MTAPRKPTEDFPPVGWRGLACWYGGRWESARRMATGGFIRAGERYEARLPDLCFPLPGETWPGEDAPGAKLRKPESWHDDDGAVLWWRDGEPPWVGTPLDSDWRGDDYFAGWTALPEWPHA
ncbi:MAG: hypothetical protein V1755_05585 [Chloroflexota bacterium]